MSDIQILIMEVCRLALQDDGMFMRIAYELDITDEELNKVLDYVKGEEHDTIHL